MHFCLFATNLLLLSNHCHIYKTQFFATSFFFIFFMFLFADLFGYVCGFVLTFHLKISNFVNAFLCATQMKSYLSFGSSLNMYIKQRPKPGNTNSKGTLLLFIERREKHYHRHHHTTKKKQYSPLPLSHNAWHWNWIFRLAWDLSAQFVSRFVCFI